MIDVWAPTYILTMMGDLRQIGMGAEMNKADVLENSLSQSPMNCISQD